MGEIDDDRDTLAHCLGGKLDIFREESLNLSELVNLAPPDPNPDTLTLSKVSAVEIRKNADTGVDFVKQEDLQYDEVRRWLGAERIIPGEAAKSQGHIYKARIMIGEQIMINDGLRPSMDYGGVKVSRQALSKATKISETVIDKLGKHEPMHLEVPPLLSIEGTPAYAVAGFMTSFAWSYDPQEQCVRAFVVLRSRCRPQYKERLFDILQSLKAFACYGEYLPYLIADLEVGISIAYLDLWEQETSQEHTHVDRLMTQRDAVNAFVGTTGRARNAPHLSAHAKVVLAASAQFASPQYLERPKAAACQTRRHVAGNDVESLRNAISFRISELQVVVDRAERLEKELLTMQTTVMSFMIFNQQVTTMEVAKATKEDSTSMRTLAVVATLYLPMTAIATVMSIPVFRWDATKEEDVVSTRFGIFVAVAVPLTCLTLAIFWYWVQVENQKTPFRALKAKVASTWKARPSLRSKLKEVPV